MKQKSEKSEAAKAAMREYFRQYRKKNPDKIRENNRRYWEKKGRELEEAANEAKAD